MTDIRDLLRRQAERQETQRCLSWSEKVRLVEALHDAIRQFQEMRTQKTRGPLTERQGEVWVRRPDVPAPGETGE